MDILQQVEKISGTSGHSPGRGMLESARSTRTHCASVDSTVESMSKSMTVQLSPHPYQNGCRALMKVCYVINGVDRRSLLRCGRCVFVTPSICHHLWPLAALFCSGRQHRATCSPKTALATTMLQVASTVLQFHNWL